MNMDPQTAGPLIGVAVAVVMILLRNRRPRILRPHLMWIFPLVITALMGLAIWGTGHTPGMPHAPFHLADWGVLALGTVLGGVAGFWRGRMTTIYREPDGVLKAQASPIGLILIVALMLGRRMLAAWLEPHAASLGLSVLAVTDTFLVFVAAMFIVQRAEMWVRARHIQAGEPDAHVEAVA